jgi:hypothetical protein
MSDVFPTMTPSGKARKIGKKRLGRPPKPGPKRHRKTDVTLAPSLIDEMKLAAYRDEVPLYEWQRLAVKSFTKYRVANPVEPPATKCPTCGRKYNLSRQHGDHRRLRVQINFDTETSTCLAWLADNFYNGTFSHAFEGAVEYMLQKATDRAKS